MKKVRVFIIIYLLQKKRSFLKVSLLLKTIWVLQRILTIFVKSKQLSTVEQMRIVFYIIQRRDRVTHALITIALSV